MKTLGIVTATALAASSPVYAQITGGGSHVEVHLGWDSLAIPDQTGQTTAQSPSSRLLYGAGAGYDVNLGHSLVLGIDSNFDLGGATNCSGPVLGTADSPCGRWCATGMSVRDWA